MRSCSAELSPPPGYDFLVVRVDGETVSQDWTHTDGWDLLDGDLLQFYGPACTALGRDGAEVTITYVCKH